MTLTQKQIAQRRDRPNHLRHGDARLGKVTRLHGIWRKIIDRCTPGNKSATNYADRGILICDEWRDYVVFRTWALANGYENTLTIDRRLNDEGYSPSNCWWTDRKRQARNRRTSRFITIDGASKTVAEWAEIKGVKARLISVRLGRGWPEDKAVNTPVAFELAP